MAVPYKQGVFDLIYGKGIDTASEIVLLASAAEILKRGGAWYSYKDDKGKDWKWQGQDAVKTAFNEDKALLEEVYNKLVALSIKPMLEEEKEDLM